MILACMVALGLLLVGTDPAYAQKEATLRGLKGFAAVSVDLADEPGTRLQASRLQTLVELKLRQAGLLDESQQGKLDHAVLSVRVTVVPILKIGFAASHNVQVTGLGRAPWGVSGWADWWQDGGVFTASTETMVDQTERAITQTMDKFLNDYYKTNPPRR